MDLLNEKFPFWNLRTSFGTSRDQLLVLYIPYGCNFCVHPRLLSRVSAGVVGSTCTFVQILQFHWTKAKRPSRRNFGWLLNNDNRPISDQICIPLWPFLCLFLRSEGEATKPVHIRPKCFYLDVVSWNSVHWSLRYVPDTLDSSRLLGPFMCPL